MANSFMNQKSKINNFALIGNLQQLCLLVIKQVKSQFNQSFWQFTSRCKLQWQLILEALNGSSQLQCYCQGLCRNTVVTLIRMIQATKHYNQVNHTISTKMLSNYKEMVKTWKGLWWKMYEGWPRSMQEYCWLHNHDYSGWKTMWQRKRFASLSKISSVINWHSYAGLGCSPLHSHFNFTLQTFSSIGYIFLTRCVLAESLYTPGFLKLLLSVCACGIPIPKAINYIHVIMNLYIKLSKFAMFQNVTKQFYPWTSAY